MIRLYHFRNTIRRTNPPSLITANTVTNTVSILRELKKRENEFTRVPKLLHRIWKVDDVTTMPRNWGKAFRKCNRVHRGAWQTMFWTDELIRSFILEKFPWFLEKFDSYRYPIQRVDVARYFILYYYGGVYLDLDVSCPQALDTLLHTMDKMKVSSMIPMTYPIGFSNDVMFATKKHPFFHELTKSLLMHDGWYGSEYITIMFTTGPMYLSSIYQDVPDSIKDDVGILHPELYTPKKGAPYKFFQHMRGHSWHGKVSKISEMRLIV